MSGLSALTYSPHHERLAPAHVSCGKYLGDRTDVMICIGLDVAARIKCKAKFVDHALVHRMHEPHGKQHEVCREFKFAPRNGFEVLVAMRAAQPLDGAVFADEFRRQYREIALRSLLVAR